MTLSELIHLFMDVAEAAEHEHECVPWGLVIDCVNHHQPDNDGVDWAGLGLLTLHCVIGRWGVDWSTFLISFPDSTSRELSYEDPGGVDWAGVSQRSGKHYISGTSLLPTGGVGLPHADSSFQRRIFEKFPQGAFPMASALAEAMIIKRRSWNQLMRSHRGDLLDWGTRLLLGAGGKLRREVHEWIVREWLRKYWQPTGETLQGMTLAHRAKAGMNAATWALNAGIANSAGGWAKRVRGKPFNEQAEYYVGKKLEKRGERAAKRAQRRVDLSKRIGVLFEAAWIAPVETRIKTATPR